MTTYLRLPILRIAPVLALWLCTGCISPLLHSSVFHEVEHLQPPVVRVRLAVDQSQFTIVCDERLILRVFTADGEESFSTHNPVTLSAKSHRLDVIDHSGITLSRAAYGVLVYPNAPNTRLTVNREPYYGTFIFGFDDSNLRMINRLNLEQYLKGVLPPELGEREANEFEAVKAQAVASRTYAIAHLGQYPNASYDLRADVSDQIYVGAQRQRDWVDRAVDATSGEVLLHTRGLIEAYYHSTCGGQTEAIEDVWGKSARPYLVAISDDTLCHWSKYSEWTETFSQKALLDNLRAYRKQVGNASVSDFDRVLDIRLEGETPGGRYRRMVIVTPDGSWQIAADQIRWALGRPSRPGTILPSSRFILELTRAEDGAITSAIAKGTGYGHGVGMCQCGMIGRSRAGESYRSILRHYYTGARIEKTY